jgi:hypothetical protein
MATTDSIARPQAIARRVISILKFLALTYLVLAETSRDEIERDQITMQAAIS